MHCYHIAYAFPQPHSRFNSFTAMFLTESTAFFAAFLAQCVKSTTRKAVDLDSFLYDFRLCMLGLV